MRLNFKHFISLAILLLLLTHAPLANASWESPNYKPNNNNIVNYTFGVNPAKLWVSDQLGTSPKIPVVDTNGNIYVTSYQKPLIALDKFGKTRWTAPGESNPILDKNGNVYFSGGSYLYAYNKEGTKLWEYLFGEQGGVLLFAISPDDSALYLRVGTWPNNKFVAFSTSGSLLWESYIGAPSPSGAGVADNGTIFASMSHAYIQAYSKDGVKLWTGGLGGYVGLSPVVSAEDGNVYAYFSGSSYGDVPKLVSYTASGTFRYLIPINLYGSGSRVVTVRGGGLFITEGYTGLYPYVLRKFNSLTGQEVWRWTAPNQQFSLITPIIDSNNVIYTANGSTVYAINPDGTLKWSMNLSLNNGSITSLSIPENNLLLVTHVDKSGSGNYKGNITALTADPDTSVDTDEDGIPDYYEINGANIKVVVDGVEKTVNVPLHLMGADKNKKDIFVHVDWMDPVVEGSEPGGVNQKPDSAALKLVHDTFYKEDINLHIDNGPDSIMDYTTGVEWGDLSKAQAMPWKRNLPGTDQNGDFNFETDFDPSYKNKSFVSTGRSPFFHYALFANFYDENHPNEKMRYSSGISRNTSDGEPWTLFRQGASDFMVTLGGIPRGSNPEEQKALHHFQAGTFMHELGHNLGLMHGGDEEVNFKPNYLSVMNYDYSWGLLKQDGFKVFDYSKGQVESILEFQLDERHGLIGGSDLDDYSAISWCLGTEDFIRNDIGKIREGINWDCLGLPDRYDFSFDVNRNLIAGDTLHDYNDWINLKFKGGAIGGSGNPIGLPSISRNDPINMDLAEILGLLNKAPVAVNDNYQVVTGNTLTVNADGVLGNDTDEDGNSLTVSAPMPVSGPVNGILTLNADGSFTYNPNVGFVGVDTFTYKANDGTTDSSAAATVTIKVLYNYEGFFQPVDNNVFNSVKAGSGIPLKFSLSGNQGTDIFETDYPKAFAISCSGSNDSVELLEETIDTAGGSSLAYDASSDQYNYVWKTDKLWEGSCKALVVKLKDGSEHKANFIFVNR